MSYGKIHDVFWQDEKIDGLSDRAALLALFLITGPHRNAVGCFRLGMGAISDYPRFAEWGIEGVSHALSELVEMGFCYRDDRTGWTFIRNALKHDPIKSFKVAIHAAGLAATFPTNTVAYRELYQRLSPILDGFATQIKGADGYPMRSPTDTPLDTPPKGDRIPKRSPSPSPEPSPSPISVRKEPTDLEDGRGASAASNGMPELPAFLRRAKP